MKIKIGFENAKSTQDFQVLATVVSSIFGGAPEKEPENFVEAKLRFEGVFGKK